MVSVGPQQQPAKPLRRAALAAPFATVGQLVWLAASKQQSHMKRAHQQRYGAADVRADLDPDMRSMAESTGDGATQVSGEDLRRYDSRVVGLA